MLSTLVCFTFRDCASHNYYLVNNQRYCGASCAARTKCGPATVPESHLNVRLDSAMCVDRWMEGWLDGRMAGWKDGWMEGWLDGRMDGWIDGWID